MTNEELDAIAQRAEQASPAPWTLAIEQGSPWNIEGHDGADIAMAFQLTPVRADYKQRDRHANAQFIAHARSDIPRLVEEVRRLRLLAKKAYEEGLSHGFHHDDHQHVMDCDEGWDDSETKKAL